MLLPRPLALWADTQPSVDQLVALAGDAHQCLHPQSMELDVGTCCPTAHAELASLEWAMLPADPFFPITQGAREPMHAAAPEERVWS